MFGTIKNEDQMNKLYERINEQGLRPRLREPYKTINRELINNIVNRRAFGSGRSL